MHVILSESVICFNDSYTSLTNTIVCILHLFSIERFTKVLKGTPIFIFKLKVCQVTLILIMQRDEYSLWFNY